ncbi:MAG TPA: PEP-CTERM sorting domain-containing protein [Acidobacteriaceae bacterium]
MFRWIYLLAALMTMHLPLMATTVYTYTGNPYTSASGPFTTSEHITINLVYDNPLAANLNFDSVIPTSFQFLDGVTFTDSSSQSPYPTEIFEFRTDNTGVITGWWMDSQTPLDQIATVSYGSAAAPTQEDASTHLNGQAYNLNSGGIWTVSTSGVAATPEPSALTLLCTGLLGGAGILRHRLRMSPDGR